MDVRKKLVELIEQSGACFDCFPVAGYEQEEIQKIASHLIANGVTVQDWISVKDRLPEEGTKALCHLKRGDYWQAGGDDCGEDLWSDGEAWCSNGEVTHWMPLPHAPKGE